MMTEEPLESTREGGIGQRFALCMFVVHVDTKSALLLLCTLTTVTLTTVTLTVCCHISQTSETVSTFYGKPPES